MATASAPVRPTTGVGATEVSVVPLPSCPYRFVPPQATPPPDASSAHEAPSVAAIGGPAARAVAPAGATAAAHVPGEQLAAGPDAWSEAENTTPLPGAGASAHSAQGARASQADASKRAASGATLYPRRGVSVNAAASGLAPGALPALTRKTRPVDGLHDSAAPAPVAAHVRRAQQALNGVAVALLAALRAAQCCGQAATAAKVRTESMRVLMRFRRDLGAGAAPIAANTQVG